MSGAWVIVPLLPIIVLVIASVLFFALLFSSAGTVPPGSTATNSTVVATIASFVGALSLYILAYFVVVILVAVMIFKMVRRRNLHFNRQILLQEDLVAIAKEMSSKKGVDVSILVNNMERSAREARFEDTEKNATLYALVGFGMPLVWLYVAYFLMKDFFKHERREDIFINETLKTFSALSLPINFPYRNPPTPDRSFALYFVLSLITGSLFGVYWVYVLVSDPNNHFRQQMMMEDTIMRQLSGTITPPPFPAPPLPPSSPS